MKSMFKILLVLVILSIAIITGIALVEYYGRLEIPELKSKNLEYGNVTDRNESTEIYEIRVKSFTSESEFINTSIKEFVDLKIEEFKNNNSTEKSIRDKDKAVLLQTIDSYLVNDNLVSVKITSMTKKIFSEETTV